MPIDKTLPKLTPETFINREISTIEFQRRVLAQAEDENLPLLERIKFLAIVGNNLDEFYMVRVASHIQRFQLGITKSRSDGHSSSELLLELREMVGELFHKQRILLREILAKLEEHGVFLVRMNQLSSEQRSALRSYFDMEVFPVLTPLAVDHARPFPFISNLSLNLGVYLARHADDDEEQYDFVRVKVPIVLPRLVNLRNILRTYGGPPVENDMLVWMEDMIAGNLDLLFPGMEVIESHPFRVLRNTDIDYEQEQEQDLDLDVKAIIEQGVRERKFGSVVRLAVPQDISERMLKRLIHELDVETGRDVYMLDGMLGSADLFEMMRLEHPELKYPLHVPQKPEILQDMPIFDAIRQQDIILHHPYDSFAPVEDFFNTAANDPDVLAIKTTLYRVGRNSPVVNALLDARDNDKQVTALVELKARFDEENNLVWAQALERKGVHVIYGVEELPMKTHSKVSLIVRREPGGVRRYVHLGTGNYNAATARLYSDMGLFTCDPDITDDATRLFNRLTGYAPATNYRRLLVAPEYLHSHIIKLIDNEIAAAREGKAARLIFKMNQLEEEIVIQKLYEASQAGVQIDLIVRGLCCLCPGIPGFSDNIRVISIIGRFLEHHRIYYFQNAPPDQSIYIGSADLMRRNLYNRVEVVFPILSPRIQRLMLRVLMTCLRDNVGAWELLSDFTYRRLTPGEGEKPIESQRTFMKNSYGLNELP